MENITAFNEHFVKNKNGSMSEKLSGSLALIGASDDLFESTNQLAVTTFYLNLYKFLGILPKEKSLNTIQQCVNIIEKGLHTEMQRKLILEQINFVPVLVDLLLNLDGALKVKRPIILELLMEMTYDFKVARHEMYIDKFIPALAEFIQNESEYSELSLRVLINICFENPICVYVLMRNVGCTEFLKSIKNHGSLASQMYMILHNEPENDLGLNALILELEKALSCWNVAHLRQTVNFIKSIDPKNDASFIESILDIIKKRLDMEDGEDLRRNCEQGMIYVFGLLNYILSGEKCPIVEIQTLAIDWINNETTIISALNVLTNIVKERMEYDCSVIVNHLPTELVLQSDNIRLKSVFLQLIKELIQFTKTCILDNETLDKFVNAFDPNDITNNNTELFLCIAFTYFISSDLNPAKFYTQFTKLMGLPCTYTLLANAYKLKDVNCVKMLLTLGQSKDFPLEQVAVVVSKQDMKSCSETCGTFIGPQLVNTVPKDTEDKLDKLLQHITESKSNDILDIEAISIYQSKIEMYRNKIELLQTTSEKQIVGLQHENAVLIAQSIQNESRELKLLLKLAEIQKEKDSLTTRVNSLQSAVSNYTALVERKKQKIANIHKAVEAKDAQLEDYKRNEIKLYATIEEKEQQNIDLEKKVMEFRTSLKQFEDICKQKETEHDKINTLNKDLNKKLTDLEKEKANLANLVKDQQKQILLNESKIQQYASELEESEETRKVIMELMNKKQRKK